MKNQVTVKEETEVENSRVLPGREVFSFLGAFWGGAEELQRSDFGDKAVLSPISVEIVRAIGFRVRKNTINWRQMHCMVVFKIKSPCVYTISIREANILGSSINSRSLRDRKMRFQSHQAAKIQIHCTKKTDCSIHLNRLTSRRGFLSF